jgi:hypothetical protein
MTTIRSFYDQLAPVYSERVKTRAGNFTILQRPELARRLLPNWTKQDHEREAHRMADRGRDAKGEYQQALNDAIAKYGDLKPGEGSISGIYNRNFPEHVKDKLRSLKDYHVFMDASLAHWKAAGKRGAPPVKYNDLYHSPMPALPPGTTRG